VSQSPLPPGIRVLPAEAAWAVRGAQLAAQVHAALAPHALRVDHIGSTAIPGMAAKPVYDLQASVADLTAVEPVFDAALARYGLARGAPRQDHVPAGSNDDPARWVKRMWSTATGAQERINLHVRLAGSPNERLALLFRDWFRTHPAAVPAYARFKQELAAAVDDLGVYSDVKDPVVDLVAAVAQEWAAATDWTP
jgi:GrpB-like predicted nucleotidyltransferase (UPF0157 family)